MTKTARRVSDLGDLSDAERKLVDELDSGEVVQIGDGDLPAPDDETRRLRAALVRLLLLGDDPDHRLHEKGVQVKGARIVGLLDLEGCRAPRDLALFNCRFEATPVLRSADIDSLFLNGSVLPGLTADRLTAKGGVFLRGVDATGEVRLLGAQLGGNLDCTGATFRTEKDAEGNPGDAFSADRLDAKGGVFLRDVTATGTVRLLGAQLGVNLDCIGSTFRAEKDAAGNPGDALSADGLAAKGGVLLRGVKATGEVRLLGAQLGGYLSCTGATFRAEKDAAGNPGFAFSADRLDAKGGVFLRDVTATGEVRLPGAQLGGDLDCTGATFRGEQDATGNLGAAFSADQLHAKGGVFLRGVDATGEVRLLAAQLGGDLDCDGATFRAEKDAAGKPGTALGLSGANVTGVFYLCGGAMIDGVLDLSAAELGSFNDHSECWPARRDLVLDRCRYGAFLGGAPVDATSRLDWLARMDPKRWGQDFWPQPYEQLAKVLREMGHGEDARAVLVEKERRQRAARRARAGNRLFAGLLWVRDALLGALVGYGRRPMRAFLWLALLWLVGAVVFWSAFREGALRPTAGEALKSAGWTGCAAGPGVGACFLASADGRHYTPFEPLVYSAETLLPVVNLDQRAHWTPDPVPVGGLGWWTRGYLWAHTLAGWALGLLAIAGFSGLVKSD